MVRKWTPDDLEKIMKIWLAGNIQAHDFIPEEFWHKNFEKVKRLLPSADIYVFDSEEVIKGFIGIKNKKYVAGLFVAPEWQSDGIGRELLDYCKEQYDFLELDVYRNNDRALTFYKKAGFRIMRKVRNGESGEEEYHMSWKKKQ